MGQSLILAGQSEAFKTVLKATLEDCGFKVGLSSGGSAAADEVFVYEIKDRPDIESISEKMGQKPYLVFDCVGLDTSAFDEFKEGGLVGVLTEASSPEEISLLVNSAFFRIRMIKRNPRATVSMPVEIRAASRSIKTTASSLSRDGLFAVTLNPLPQNTVCEVSFSDPVSGEKLTTGARVLYSISINKDLSIISSPVDPFKRIVTHPGMALLFLDLPEQNRVRLEDYVRTIG